MSQKTSQLASAGVTETSQSTITTNHHSQQQQKRQEGASAVQRSPYHLNYKAVGQREYYLSRGFSDDLDDIDPAEVCKQIEVEEMHPVQVAVQQQAHEYEKSLRYEEGVLHDADGMPADFDPSPLLEQIDKEKIEQREAALQREVRLYERSLKTEEISSIVSIVYNPQYPRK